MTETERYIPFRVEFLICLAPSLMVLTLVIFILTGELSIFIVTFTILVAFLLGAMWVTYKEYKSRLGKRGILGYLLLLFSNFMDEWIWVRLCLVLLGTGLMLYDIASKRHLSNA